MALNAQKKLMQLKPARNQVASDFWKASLRLRNRSDPYHMRLTAINWLSVFASMLSRAGEFDSEDGNDRGFPLVPELTGQIAGARHPHFFGTVAQMMPNNVHEHELAHITSMIAQLERLSGHESRLSQNFVFKTAYWRTRVRSVVTQIDASGTDAARASALLARLDALDDGAPQSDCATHRAADR
jgi:hypothetical protein